MSTFGGGRSQSVEQPGRLPVTGSLPSTELPHSQPVVSSAYGRRDYLLRRALAAGDLLAVLVAYTVAFLPRPQTLGYIAWALPTLPVWLLIFKGYGLYDRDIKRISHATVDDLPWLLHALLVGSLLTWGWYGVVPLPELSFGYILIFAGAATIIALVLRAAIRRGTPAALGPERVLMFGGGSTTALIMRKMRDHPEYGLKPVGLVTTRDDFAPADFPPLPPLGEIDLAAVVQRLGVERLIIAQEELDETAVLDLVRTCKWLSLKVSLLPPPFGAMGPSVEVDDVEGVTVLGINPPVLTRSSRMIKRGLDLVGATLGLIVLAPILVLAGVAIKLDSRGPVLFRQERTGRGGRRFTMLKFRTMVEDAEQQREQLVASSTDPNWLMLEEDPRITRLGRILRHTSIDELPQLWNVLRGHMSLVGPRPMPDPDDARIEGWSRSRLDLTPGITGLWQVLGRTRLPFDEMLKLDYVYVTNWSLWNDVRLILRTLPAVLGRRGVN